MVWLTEHQAILWCAVCGGLLLILLSPRIKQAREPLLFTGTALGLCGAALLILSGWTLWQGAALLGLFFLLLQGVKS